MRSPLKGFNAGSHLCSRPSAGSLSGAAQTATDAVPETCCSCLWEGPQRRSGTGKALSMICWCSASQGCFNLSAGPRGVQAELIVESHSECHMHHADPANSGFAHLRLQAPRQRRLLHVASSPIQLFALLGLSQADAARPACVTCRDTGC